MCPPIPQVFWRSLGSKCVLDSYVALAECFIAAGEPNKLYQFLHYHVLADSVELADLMVRNGDAFPSLMQVGLDMYFRLGEFCPLVRTLLEIEQVGCVLTLEQIVFVSLTDLLLPIVL
jgi:hypothetical protein